MNTFTLINRRYACLSVAYNKIIKPKQENSCISILSFFFFQSRLFSYKSKILIHTQTHTHKQFNASYSIQMIEIFCDTMTRFLLNFEYDSFIADQFHWSKFEIRRIICWLLWSSRNRYATREKNSYNYLKFRYW